MHLMFKSSGCIFAKLLHILTHSQVRVLIHHTHSTNYAHTCMLKLAHPLTHTHTHTHTHTNSQQKGNLHDGAPAGHSLCCCLWHSWPLRSMLLWATGRTPSVSETKVSQLLSGIPVKCSPGFCHWPSKVTCWLHKAQYRCWHNSSERSWDLHMPPKTQNWEHSALENKRTTKHDCIFLVVIFICWKFRHTISNQIVWINRSGECFWCQLVTWVSGVTKLLESFVNETTYGPTVCFALKFLVFVNFLPSFHHFSQLTSIFSMICLFFCSFLFLPATIHYSTELVKCMVMYGQLSNALAADSGKMFTWPVDSDFLDSDTASQRKDHC